MKLPSMPRKGQPVEDTVREIINFCRSVRITGCAGGNVKITPNGTTLDIKPGNNQITAAAATATPPWKPSFFTTGSAPSLVYKCRFNLGTINDIPATNWNDDFTLSMAADAYYFVIATVASSSGQVSGVTLSVEATAPATDNIASGTPPVEHKIVLGAIGRTSAKMIETTNLSMTAAVVFLESKSAPAQGAEPFDRWWRWNHATI